MTYIIKKDHSSLKPGTDPLEDTLLVFLFFILEVVGFDLILIIS